MHRHWCDGVCMRLLTQIYAIRSVVRLHRPWHTCILFGVFLRSNVLCATWRIEWTNGAEHRDPFNRRSMAVAERKTTTVLWDAVVEHFVRNPYVNFLLRLWIEMRKQISGEKKNTKSCCMLS